MRVAAGAAIVALGLIAACGSAERPIARSTPTPTPAASRSGTPPPAPGTQRTGTVVITADSKYGPMLYDASGQPIYLFDKERGTTPQCYDACAEAWPPVFTKALPQARKSTRESLLGTTRRTDGRLQVTYAGHPLYYYAHEGKYQVLCHNVTEYGGTWLVVRPNGTPAPG